MRVLLARALVFMALAGLVLPQELEAKGGGGSGGSRSSGSYKTPTYKSPYSTGTSKATTYRSTSSSKKTSTFHSARYTSTSAARVYKAPPPRMVRSPSVVGAQRTLTGQTRVHDGDTFYADGKRIRVRGIDTPELGQPRSYEAKARLEQLLHSGTVTIEPRAIDRYGRTVATVRVNGQDVSQIMRAEGLAKPH